MIGKVLGLAMICINRKGIVWKMWWVKGRWL